ncbi:hypothetical protein ACFQ64_05960 [Streptomyces sp. NPDC056460]|uniref:hypothetical protein n=1 Tax=Streptomyces sp. NPDC056460 TaxID=3345825 RepID=UPI003684D5F8
MAGHLRQRSRIRVRAFPSHQDGEEDGGLGRGQRAEGQPVDALQSREHPAAGDQHHRVAHAREQRTHLGLVAGVVQHQQAASLGQNLPARPGVPLRTGHGQLPVGDPERLQHAEEEFGVRWVVVHAAQVEHQLPVRETFGQLVGRS